MDIIIEGNHPKLFCCVGKNGNPIVWQYLQYFAAYHHRVSIAGPTLLFVSLELWMKFSRRRHRHRCLSLVSSSYRFENIEKKKKKK